jgi:hypothetical protein
MDSCEKAGLRLLGGPLPRRWLLTRSGLMRVIAADVNEASSIAVIWVVVRQFDGRLVERDLHYEFRESQWQSEGSGSETANFWSPDPRPAAQQSGPACLLVPLHSEGGRSADGWVAYAAFRAAQEVVALEVESRTVPVPSHGYCLVTWKSPVFDRSAPRPLLRALGSHGEVLTEYRPGEYVDTATLAAV